MDSVYLTNEIKYVFMGVCSITVFLPFKSSIQVSKLRHILQTSMNHLQLPHQLEDLYSPTLNLLKMITEVLPRHMHLHQAERFVRAQVLHCNETLDCV